MKIGRGIRRSFSLSPIYSNCTANTLPRTALKGLETSEDGGQILRRVKCATG